MKQNGNDKEFRVKGWQRGVLTIVFMTFAAAMPNAVHGEGLKKDTGPKTDPTKTELVEQHADFSKDMAGGGNLKITPKTGDGDDHAKKLSPEQEKKALAGFADIMKGIADDTSVKDSPQKSAAKAFCDDYKKLTDFQKKIASAEDSSSQNSDQAKVLKAAKAKAADGEKNLIDHAKKLADKGIGPSLADVYKASVDSSYNFGEPSNSKTIDNNSNSNDGQTQTKYFDNLQKMVDGGKLQGDQLKVAQTALDAHSAEQASQQKVDVAKAAINGFQDSGVSSGNWTKVASDAQADHAKKVQEQKAAVDALQKAGVKVPVDSQQQVKVKAPGAKF